MYVVLRYLCMKHTISIQENNGRSSFRCPTYSQKWTKTDSCAAHYKRHFKSTTTLDDLCRFMKSKVVNQIYNIRSMKSFTKHNCNKGIEEH